jgi:tRNA G18 (ribose-2'-O)-methylase SpoU
VQNPANLGGLCRTAEAFRLEKLILADMAITRHPLFRNLAVSTHQWQPLAACSIAQLPTWLAQQTQIGYTVIGLDADPLAIPLPQFQFPLRSILLLGQELTGLPASLATHCQVCITIPQWGLVESLNVQTAGAIAMYAYIQQRSLPNITA